MAETPVGETNKLAGFAASKSFVLLLIYQSTPYFDANATREML
jgi:hypothetical protein